MCVWIHLHIISSIHVGLYIFTIKNFNACTTYLPKPQNKDTIPSLPLFSLLMTLPLHSSNLVSKYRDCLIILMAIVSLSLQCCCCQYNTNNTISWGAVTTTIWLLWDRIYPCLSRSHDTHSHLHDGIIAFLLLLRLLIKAMQMTPVVCSVANCFTYLTWSGCFGIYKV